MSDWHRYQMNWQPGMPIIGYPTQSQGMDALRLYLQQPAQIPKVFGSGSAIHFQRAIQKKPQGTPTQLSEPLEEDHLSFLLGALREAQGVDLGFHFGAKRLELDQALSTPNCEVSGPDADSGGRSAPPCSSAAARQENGG